jgi:hypothetical protein
MSLCEQISAFLFLNMVPRGELQGFFCGRVSQLLLTWERMFGASAFQRAANPKGA